MLNNKGERLKRLKELVSRSRGSIQFGTHPVEVSSLKNPIDRAQSGDGSERESVQPLVDSKRLLDSDSISHEASSALGPEQRNALEYLDHSNGNVFVTGKAGTGKSHLLRYFAQSTSKTVLTVAPTGVAAVNVNGMTIHSAFQLPIRFAERSEIIENFDQFKRSRTYPILRNLDTLIIDEISMVRADIIDLIDATLRLCQNPELAFGGVQVVMFGDMFQLEPIVDDDQLLRYFRHQLGGYKFFHAEVWNEADLKVIELTQPYRQQDSQFLEILDSIRSGQIKSETLGLLNQRVVSNDFEAPIGTVTLTATNAVAAQINQYRLERLAPPERKYMARITDNFDKRIMPADAELTLRHGAQVMVLKNIFRPILVNGTVGIVHAMEDDEVLVEVEDVIQSIRINSWDHFKHSYDLRNRKVSRDLVGKFDQYPLRLAWGITTHKSQGKTFDSVLIDYPTGPFTSGQTYVALSRCTSLERTYLRSRIQHSDLIVDPDAISFLASAKYLPV